MFNGDVDVNGDSIEVDNVDPVETGTRVKVCGDLCIDIAKNWFDIITPHIHLGHARACPDQW